MKTSIATLKDLGAALAAMNGADVVTLPLAVARALVEDARERQRYEERVDRAFNIKDAAHVDMGAGTEEWIGSDEGQAD